MTFSVLIVVAGLGPLIILWGLFFWVSFVVVSCFKVRAAGSYIVPRWPSQRTVVLVADANKCYRLLRRRRPVSSAFVATVSVIAVLAAPDRLRSRSANCSASP